MKLYASDRRNCFLDIYDANGVRLKGVIEADTETGLVTKFSLDTFGRYRFTDAEAVTESKNYPAPLRVYDIKLNIEITSQSQIDFLERSRIYTAAANYRWKAMNKRANHQFQILALKHNIQLRGSFAGGSYP